MKLLEFMDLGTISFPGVPMIVSTYLIYWALDQYSNEEELSDSERKQLQKWMFVVLILFCFNLFFWGLLPLSIHLISEY
jgi:hypothetical protein